MATRPLNFPAWLAQTPGPHTAPTTLSGERYLLRWHWSPLAGAGAGAWLVDLSGATGIMLAPSVDVVLTEDLWACYKSDTRVPQGKLAITRVSGEGDPGPKDLGAAVGASYTD